jgi:NAD(P)-dependent dehydrogenase (short-subunit alcohol dehydrogenase family)
MVLDKFRLDGRTAVVTGGGKGIGWAIAQAFSEAGAKVIIAELDPTTGTAAAAKLASEGGRAAFVQLDVANPAAVRDVTTQIRRGHGDIDILVNNAGICLNSSALETTDDLWRRQMMINLDGLFYCCREFGRGMVERGKGSIVNLSSMAGVIDVRPQHHIGYSASKAAVTQVSRVLAAEWARSGVRVNAIGPGYVATEMPLAAAKGDPGMATQWMSMVPRGTFIEPNEIAAAVLFLASDAASAITGHLLIADAGYTVW